MLDRDHDQVRARAPPSHVEGRRLAGRGTHRTGPTFNGNRWPTKMGSSMLIGAAFNLCVPKFNSRVAWIDYY